MMNNFEEVYAKKEAIEAAYDEAEKAMDETAMDCARVAMRALRGDIDAQGREYSLVYHLYESMRDLGNDHIDLHDTIHDEYHFIDTLRSFGIKSFTFSSSWSSAVESAWIFQQCGCKLEGLIELNSPIKAFRSEEYDKVHGYLFSL